MNTNIEKHLEIKAYTHLGVRVLVEIDYDKEVISLLEQPQRNATKKWVFAGRGLEYIAGWRNVLSAMEYAISQAEADLKKHVNAKEKEKVRMHIKVMRAAEKERS